MMKIILLFVIALLVLPVRAQINREESSVQVVGYWDKGESHTYDVITESAEVKGSDTIVTESIRCKVDVTVLDSTAKSYIVEWKYRDYEVQANNPLVEKLAKLNEGLTLKIKTDELGSFIELLNWTDVKKFNQEAVKLLENDPQASLVQNFLVSLKDRYSSREAIEAHSIKDIKLFYDLFGIAIKEGEPLSSELSDLNPITQENIMSNVNLELVEIDTEEDVYLLAYTQVFDKDSSLMLIKKLLAGTVPQNVLDTFRDVSLIDSSATQMHESGWPLSLYYERTIMLGGKTRIDSREINFEN